MELLAGYDSDDESTSDIDEELNKDSTRKKKIILPSPDEALKKPVSSSVFKLKENKDSDILEKHVKMVENKQNITEVNGRKVCWMYRQGRCRFGKKCKMFHDSELRDTKATETDDTVLQSSEKTSIHNQKFLSMNYQDAEEESEVKILKKKRYGVTDTLEPPKKALKEIKRIQHKYNQNK